jgi:hypothetical protein
VAAIIDTLDCDVDVGSVAGLICSAAATGLRAIKWARSVGADARKSSPSGEANIGSGAST